MTSYSGLWNNEYGENYSTLSDDVRSGNTKTAIARVMSHRLYMRGAARELLKALIGAASGDNATASHKRVAAERDLNMNVQGGKRTIETFESVNRDTTEDDADYFTNALDQSSQPTYVGDKSGNGGGNKLGW